MKRILLALALLFLVPTVAEARWGYRPFPYRPYVYRPFYPPVPLGPVYRGYGYPYRVYRPVVVAPVVPVYPRYGVGMYYGW